MRFCSINAECWLSPCTAGERVLLNGDLPQPPGCWEHGAHGAAASPGGPHSSFVRSRVSTHGREQPDPVEGIPASGSGVGTSQEGPFHPRWFDDSMISVPGCTQCPKRHCWGCPVASPLPPPCATQPAPPGLAVSFRVTQIKLHVVQLHARARPAAMALVTCWCCTRGRSGRGASPCAGEPALAAHAWSLEVEK